MEKVRIMRAFGHIVRRAFASIVPILLLFADGIHRPISAETTRGASVVGLSQPQGVCVDEEENILVASPGNDSIVFLRGRPKLQFEEDTNVSSFVPYGIIIGEKGGTLAGARDVALGPGGRVVVTDTGHDLVKIYDDLQDARRYSVEIIRKGSSEGFSSPEGATVDEEGNIIVFDTGNGRVDFFSSKGRLLAVLSGKPDQKRPDLRTPLGNREPYLSEPAAGCCIGNGYLAVGDKGLSTFSIWKYVPASPSSETCRFVGYGPPREEALNFHIRDIAYDRDRRRVAYIGSNSPLRNAAFLYIHGIDPNNPSQGIEGDTQSSHRISLVGWIEDPAGLAFNRNGDLFITDAAANSVQKINRETFEILNSPVAVESQRTRARLQYFSTAEVATSLEYGAVPPSVGRIGVLERSYTDPAKVFAHTAALTGLFPSSRYAYRFLLSRDFFRQVSGETLPNLSEARLFVTESAPRRTEYLDFPVTVLFFTNVVEGGAAPKEPEPLESARIEKVRAQLESARVFFWVNSRMACNLKPNLTVIGEKLDGAALPLIGKGNGRAAKLEEFLRGLEGLARKYAGSDLSSLRNLFIIYAVRAYDAQQEGFVLGSFPAMTSGLDLAGGAVSIFAYSDDLAGSFVEEYGSQLSFMQLASGRSDVPADLSSDAISDRTMVSWDSSADLMRALGKKAWLGNRFGIFRVANDDDEDGIPDDEPNCPLDEKKLGTSPEKKDTDGDGVRDVDEVLASRWARGFTLAGARAIDGLAKVSPAARDTDGDGIADSEDKNPLCPLNDSIQMLEIAIDGKIGQGEWEGAAMMRIVDSEYSGILRAGWGRRHLCFALTGVGPGVSEGPPSIRIRLDGTANGFLRGSDNITLVFTPTQEGSFTVRQERGGFGLKGDGASGETPWVDLPQVVAAWSMTQDSLQVEIGLPKSPSIGLNLFGEEQIGFDFEFRPVRSSFWLRTFDPLTLVRCRLAPPRKQVEMQD
jgi:hypothetical protein